MAAHLLAHITIPDSVWTSEPRLPGETRSPFVRRVLLGETAGAEQRTPEPKAAELGGKKRGCYLLNTDGGNSGNSLGRAAIGVLLRTRHLVSVAQMSRSIGPATHNVAEYRALIAGLELARDHGIQRLRVYMDSELVVDQVNGVSAVKQAHLIELHEVSRRLVALFASIRISWVPREMNTEADRLVRTALDAPDE
jgi:ribonuclease HI